MNKQLTQNEKDLSMYNQMLEQYDVSDCLHLVEFFFFLCGKYFQVQSKISKGWTVDLASINFVSNKKKIFEVN